VQARRRAEISHRRQRDVVLPAERHEIEALRAFERAGDEVAGAANRARGPVVAPETSIGVRAGDAIERPRALQWGRTVAERLSGAGGGRPASAILFGPRGGEQALAVRTQLLERQREFLAVAEMPVDRALAAEPRLRMKDGGRRRGKQHRRR